MEKPRFIGKNGYVLQDKTHYRKDFDGSNRLFDACWRQYRYWLNGSIDNPQSDCDVSDWLDTIASEKVNNTASTFYIYG